MSLGHFFAVDRRAWIKASSLGMNPGVAYLVLARGTGADQRTTAWSVHAIERYTGISRSRAVAAIRALIEVGLVEVRNGSPTKPRYYLLPCPDSVAVEQPLQQSPDWIWLPNEIVTEVTDAPSAIERIRQTGDARALRLFAELYGVTNLPGDGGIHWHQIRREFHRELVGEHGPYIILAFLPGDVEAFESAQFVSPFATGAKKHSQRARMRDADWDDFWRSWDRLQSLGLVQFVDHLVESDEGDAEIIHPLASAEGGEPIEHQITLAADKAARAMLPSHKLERLDARSSPPLLVSVLKHQDRAQVFGIARMRYRPKTRDTTTWFSRLTCEGLKWVQVHLGRIGSGYADIARISLFRGRAR